MKSSFLVMNNRFFSSSILHTTDRFWSGLSTDLTIEQILMRSVKSCGGLTRGRGMGESANGTDLSSIVDSLLFVGNQFRGVRGYRCTTNSNIQRIA